jgi:hypothetical protein
MKRDKDGENSKSYQRTGEDIKEGRRDGLMGRRGRNMEGVKKR